MRERMSRKKYVLVYTALFALLSVCVFLLFLKKGRSMVWNQDGGPQYLPYLAYMGRYLRDFFGRAVHGDFTLQMFDWKIGFGNDVSAVVRPHPLDFLSVFVPVRYTEILYHVILILRLYLAGLSFSLFCTLFREPSLNMINGSLIYVYSGFVFCYAVEHPIYGAAMIMLPLLLTGAEKMMRKEGLHLFAAAVFLGFICNYYFMYQCTIACVLYILLRFPTLYPERRVRNFLILFIRMAPVYLLGTGMAMATLWPVIRSLGSSARLAEQSSPGNLLSYESPRIFYQWFLFLVSPGKGLPGGTHLNYCVLVVPALILLFTRRRKGSFALKAAFAAGTVFLLIPFFGYMMAGFSTVNNRWVFIYSFIVSLAFVLYIQEAEEAGRLQKIVMAAALMIFTALAVLEYVTFSRIQGLVGSVLLAAASAAVFAGRQISRKKGVLPVCMLMLTLASCSVNAWFEYSGRFGNAVSEYLEAGSGLKLIERSEFAKLGRIKEEGFWRADSNLINSNRENYSLLLDYYPTSMYNSVLSGPVTYALLEQNNLGLAAIHRIQGLDGRTAAEASAAVRYFLTSVDGQPHVPYGFAYSEELSDGDNAIYVNQYPLQFGVLHTKLMDLSEYDKLDALAKEQVLLDAAITDVDALPVGSSQTAARMQTQDAAVIEEVPLELPGEGDHVKRTQDGYRVTQKGGYIVMQFERKAGCEAYLRLEGFSNERTSTYVYVHTSDQTTPVLMRGPGTVYSLNKVDYDIRLGYDEDSGSDYAALEFQEKGTYTLEAARICYVPVQGIEDKIEALNRCSLQSPVFGINTVSGTVNADTSGMMVFSIPYSEGWTAQVDGESTPVYQADTAWTGIWLEPGEHQVSLSYTTPGAVTGRIIALICWAVFVLLFPARKRLGRAAA